MSVEVKFTVRFSFANGCAKPSMEEIADFVKALDADPVQMFATYRIAEEKSLNIKFKTEEAMLHCLLHNREQLTFHYSDGKAVEVRMSPADGNVQYVRIYDLPPEVPNSGLALVLGKYGEVKRVVREKFPVDLGLDMYTGVRGVYMDVKKEIPNSLHFLNRKGNIFYQGNKNLCFVCKMEGHRMNSCPKRKDRKLSGQQEEGNQRNEGQSSTSTYAGVVTGDAPNNNNSQKTEERVEVLQEEVLEMEVTSPETEKASEEETTVAQKQDPPVFKCDNDRYYFYRFGIVDYTEKERIKDEEEAKRRAMEQEKRLEELKQLRRRQKEEAKLNSPPRKNKKNS